MSNAKKVIAVVGATGAQGRGLVRAILDDPAGGFAVRALTRDVTFFWAHFSPEKEIAQVAAMARAAKQAGLRHVIWSTLEDTRLHVPLTDDRMPTLLGRYKSPHFDAKGEADRFFTEAGVPTTFLLTSFYWDNLIHFGMGPRADGQGRLALTLPLSDRKLPGIAAADIGPAAYGILKEGLVHVGKRIGVAGEHLGGAEMAAALTSALGREVRYHAIAPADYRALGFPGADDLGNMFQYKVEFNDGFRAARNVEATRRLHPGLQTFAQWLVANATRIPLAA